MKIKKETRLRRAAKTRHKIRQLGIETGVHRLVVHRSNQHIYASLLSPMGGLVLATASSLELRGDATLPEADKSGVARWVGQKVAERAIAAGVSSQVACDRSGFHYHGRIKAVVEGAREIGLLV
ncbi:MAG: 50S ribosomal protein L18 [Pseudomonadota bacterium]